MRILHVFFSVLKVCKLSVWAFVEGWQDGFFFLRFIIVYYFGCDGPSLPHTGFLQLQRAGATLCCAACTSHRVGFSYCRAQALGTWASVVAAHRLSCSVACEIFLGQGLNSCSLPWKVLTTEQPGEVLHLYFRRSQAEGSWNKCSGTKTEGLLGRYL